MIPATAEKIVDSFDDEVLLKDWDIERFFSNDRNLTPHSPNCDRRAPLLVKGQFVSNKLASKCEDPTFVQKCQEKGKSSKRDYFDENASDSSELKSLNELVPKNCSNLRNEQASDCLAKPKSSFFSHLVDNTFHNKRQETDSKISLNFLRGFRRENSDFFPLSKRHSAILGERQSATKLIRPHRTSAIYTKHDAINDGEPILMDFVSRSYLENAPNNNSQSTISKNTSQASEILPLKSIIHGKNIEKSQGNFIGPRREKTESVILLRNSSNCDLLFCKQQQVKHLSLKHIKQINELQYNQ